MVIIENNQKKNMPIPSFLFDIAMNCVFPEAAIDDNRQLALPVDLWRSRVCHTPLMRWRKLVVFVLDLRVLNRICSEAEEVWRRLGVSVAWVADLGHVRDRFELF
ncbi:hypothetical protein CASFOL_001455 [Castilleja foliolosa]|uniref:Uncharacterized protein n=1 Tax=Castilleja foliolosa TaxID=1961234 RepID=A0ABD3EJX6_9LAMI